MSKLRFEKDKKQRSAKNAGYYIALAVCLAAVGFAGFRYLGNKEDKVNTQNPSGGVAETVQPTTTPKLEDDWDAIAEQVDAQIASQESLETAATPETTTTPSPTTAVQKTEKVTYTLPVKGKLHKSFSGTELVYCETMQDWRVHSGADITAAKGDKVKTAAAGEVLDVIADEMLGTTVIIRHNDGLMVYYSGLSAKALVKKGEKIEDGTVIGAIDTVPCEISDPPHLHLAAKKDGDWVDPIEAMGLNIS